MIWRDDVVAALTSLGGVAHLSKIYEAVEEIRAAKKEMPTTWQAIVRRELEHNSSDSDSYQGRHDLFYSVEGVGRGVWGLRSVLLTPTPAASDVMDPPARVEARTYRIIRDTKISRELKRLHSDSCQLCGLQLRVGKHETYSEGHHIQPLGEPHNGPDISENILILCPSCHVLCDYFSIELNVNNIHLVPGHDLGDQFILYHNERWRRLEEAEHKKARG